jgi:hypothetical protein
MEILMSAALTAAFKRELAEGLWSTHEGDEEQLNILSCSVCRHMYVIRASSGECFTSFDNITMELSPKEMRTRL